MHGPDAQLCRRQQQHEALRKNSRPKTSQLGKCVKRPGVRWPTGLRSNSTPLLDGCLTTIFLKAPRSFGAHSKPFPQPPLVLRLVLRSFFSEGGSLGEAGSTKNQTPLGQRNPSRWCRMVSSIRWSFTSSVPCIMPSMFPEQT